jgi:hypothetical protein
MRCRSIENKYASFQHPSFPRRRESSGVINRHQGLSLHRKGLFLRWIPACAGMTEFELSVNHP